MPRICPTSGVWDCIPHIDGARQTELGTAVIALRRALLPEHRTLAAEAFAAGVERRLGAHS
jgi:hypothetical protein